MTLVSVVVLRFHNGGIVTNDSAAGCWQMSRLTPFLVANYDAGSVVYGGQKCFT